MIETARARKGAQRNEARAEHRLRALDPDETDAPRSPVTVRIDGDPGDVDYSDTRTGGAATVRAEWT